MAKGTNNCRQVVTIGYINSILHGVIEGNMGSCPGVMGCCPQSATTESGETYCPTYSQLTGGSVIQYYSWETSPSLDTDGIYVNPICTDLGTPYSGNQVVNREDLSLRYTRHVSTDISGETSVVDSCGGEVKLLRIDRYRRYKKEMNQNCVWPENPTYEEITISGDPESSYSYTFQSPRHGTVRKGDVVPAGQIRYDYYSASTNSTSSARSDTFYCGAQFRCVNTGTMDRAITISQDICCANREYKQGTTFNISQGVDKCGSGGVFPQVSAATRCNSSDAWEQAKLFSVWAYKTEGEDIATFNISSSGLYLEYHVEPNCTTEQRISKYTIYVQVGPQNPSTGQMNMSTVNLTITQGEGKCNTCPCDCEEVVLKNFN